jgi:hypothetical protein
LEVCPGHHPYHSVDEEFFVQFIHAAHDVDESRGMV